MSTPPALPALPPIPPNIATITAPLMFGIMISWAFYGALTVQVYIYHLCFPGDKRSFKLLVYGVYFLDTLQTCLTGVDAWYWFCAGFGNLIHLSNPYISTFDTPMLGSLISLIVQMFFCHRIWTLSKHKLWWLSILIGSISLLQVAAGFISGVRGHMAGNFAAARAHIDLVALYIWLIGSAVADIAIAAAMTYLLLQNRRDEHKRTNAILYRLVRLTMETNLLSATFAFISLVIYFTIPTASFFISPTFILGKTYSNTLLVSFNNRVFIAGLGGQGHSLNSSGDRSARLPPTPQAVVHFHRSQSPTLSPNSGGSFGESYKIESFGDIERAADNLHLDHLRSPSMNISTTKV